MHTTKQMEDLQISYTSALCAAVDISYDTQRHDDDSTDAIIKKTIFLSNGCRFFSQLRIQLKSTCSPSQYTDTGDCIKYTLKVKNYNDLCTPSTMPIILCLLILPEDDTRVMFQCIHLYFVVEVTDVTYDGLIFHLLNAHQTQRLSLFPFRNPTLSAQRLFLIF